MASLEYTRQKLPVEEDAQLSSLPHAIVTVHVVSWVRCMAGTAVGCGHEQ